MAKLDKKGNIVGKLGDLRYYVLNGENIVATKGGPSSKQFKKSKSYENHRKFGSEFGFKSKVASQIYASLKPLKPIIQSDTFSLLNKKLIQLFNKDAEGELGKRSLLFSANKNHFDRTPLSKEEFSDYCFLRPEFKRTKDNIVEMIIPACSAATQFMFRGFYSKVDWTCSIQGIKDFKFNDKLKSYTIESRVDVLPMTTIYQLESTISSNIEEVHHKLALQPDYTYLVYLKASFLPLANKALPIIHVMEISGMI
ncbi:MAG: hypothetical protein ABIO44_09070 [Saprospiraceae bacterium]